LNKAVRIPDIDILFKLGFFIQHWHQLIVSSNSPSSSSIKTVYRGQLLTKDELDAWTNHEDGPSCWSSGHFFEASIDRPEQLVFELTQGDERQEVLFQIDVSNSSSFVEIDEKILVNFGLVTRIEKISNEKHC
jgi:hypothetical protein